MESYTKLNEKDLVTLITNFYTSKGKKVKFVQVSARSVTRGYGHGEYTDYVPEATVHFETEPDIEIARVSMQDASGNSK